MAQLLTMGDFPHLEYLACCSGEAKSPKDSVAHLPVPVATSQALGFPKWQ